MSCNLDQIWKKFHSERVNPLSKRFPGYYRALVVETNDPLQWYRIRFKCPELHDYNLKPEDCPWADRSPELGGKNAGSWNHPCIGDIVWITFEKNHPYGPVWVGFASETRRRRYSLESIYTESPLAVKEDGTADKKPTDYLTEYLPKDHRPMSTGWRDRYGNSEINSAVGFFPIEHKEKPADVGTDAIGRNAYSNGSKPVINQPDRKYVAKVSKYGTYHIQSDVGYFWMKEDNSNLGEFKGNFEEDIEWEVKRTKYLTKLFNENEPNSENRDQRRVEQRTRAGHKFEMRDVGWAQKGGGLVVNADAGECKARKDEYSEERVLSKWTKSDERWLKLRSKGGHIIQFMDAGFHPEKDLFYKKNLIDDIGADADGEAGNWTKRDSRQIRIVTRWGIKFVLDDRGTDGIDAEGKEKERGNGWLIKTRRSWTIEPTTPRGFGFEANDKDGLDTTRWYTPKSKIIEMNDRKDYVLMSTDTKGEISEKWVKLAENEFAKKIAMTEDPEKNTYHLKLDKANGYIRLKTASGGDNGLRPQPEPFPNADIGEPQGLECRDGRTGADGPWVELNDIEDRGLFFSKRRKYTVWHSNKDQAIIINDGTNTLVIRNNEEGALQLYCKKDIELISDGNISLKAAKMVSFKAGTSINMEANGSGHAQLTSNAWNSDVTDNAPAHPEKSVGCQVLNPQKADKVDYIPSDRGHVSNGGFGAVEDKVITG